MAENKRRVEYTAGQRVRFAADLPGHRVMSYDPAEVVSARGRLVEVCTEVGGPRRLWVHAEDLLPREEA